MMEISAFCNRGNFTQCLTYSVALFVYVNVTCVCARVQMCVGVDVVSKDLKLVLQLYTQR